MAIYSDRSSPQTPRPSVSAHKIKGRAIVFMVIALVAGLASAFLVLRFVRNHGGRTIPTTQVVVAASDIAVGTKLTAAMLKTADWPADAKPRGSFAGIAGLEDRVASSPILADEPILEARLGAKGAGAGMASLIPSNMRAMTVPVNEIVGVGGFIHPGDVVDVITTMQETAPGATQATYRSRIVLQNISVIAVGQHLAASDEAKAQTVPAVTLLVSPPEAERLALASTQGKLQLTMRSHVDREQVATPGVAPSDLLGPHEPAPPVRAAPPEPPPAAIFAMNHHHLPSHALGVAPPPAASAPPSASPIEVIEVMRGDKIEQRKVNPKVAP